MRPSTRALMTFVSTPATLSADYRFALLMRHVIDRYCRHQQFMSWIFNVRKSAPLMPSSLHKRHRAVDDPLIGVRVNLSDRILVCQLGRFVEEFTAGKATEESIMYAALH